MSNSSSFFANSAEALFYVACTGIVASGIADNVIVRIPVLGYVLAAGALSLLIKMILTLDKPAPFIKSFRAIFIICFLIVAAVHCTSKLISSDNVFFYPNSPLFFLYYAVIITYALAGKGLSLLGVVVICCASEAVNCGAHGYFNDSIDLNGRDGLSRASLLLPPFVSMLFAAAIPYVIVATKGKQEKQPHTKPAVSSAGRDAAAAAVQESAPVPRPGKTGVLSPGKTGLLSPSKTSVLITRQDIEETYVEPDEIDDLLSSVVYFMSRNFKAYSSLGFIYDPMSRIFTLNSFHSKSMSVLKNVQIPLGSGIVGKIGVDKRPFISGDLAYYNDELSYYPGGVQVSSVVAVPVISEAKDLLGALIIDSQDKHAFRDEHKEILQRFARFAAALITNVRMRVFQERAAAHFRIFYEASQQFTRALNLDKVFDVLVTMVAQVTAFKRIVVITANERDGNFTINKIRGVSPDLQEGYTFESGMGLYSYAFQKGKIVNLSDFQRFIGRYFRFFPEETGNEAIRSLIIIPLMGEQERVSALLSIESDLPDQFVGDMETMLFTLAGNAAVALTRARLYRQMELLAITDGLTRLYNHKEFQSQLEKEIERSKRYKRPLSLLLMDIDHFKMFNDTYGHQAGDIVLMEIAQCIRESIRINDNPARYGGEEFAVIIPENDERGAVMTGERIRQTIERRPIMSGDKQLHVTISIGCAAFPGHAGNQMDLIACADKALYYSKRTGRNRVSIYTPDMRAGQ